MKLTKLSKERNDWHFWQILVVCSGAEFRQSGASLIHSLELNSPDTRVVVFLTDGEIAARSLLSSLGKKLLSVTLYEARADGVVEGGERYEHIATLLEMTRLPALLLRVDSFVRRDLSLLPAELQKCDCSMPLRLNRKHSAERVRISSIWLAANYNIQSFLKEVTRYLAGIQNEANSLPDADVRNAFYFALLRCNDFVRVAPMPSKFCDRKDESFSYIVSDLSSRTPALNVRQEQETVRHRFDATVSDVIYYPKQDLGTKASLKNNHFKLRLSRLSRPGRIYWRFMARFLAEATWRNGRNARIVALPQWEISSTELKDLDDCVQQIHLPHLIRKQLDHPKARYYMQELLPDLFTSDDQGWGAASRAFGRLDYLSHNPDDRLDDFLHSVRASRTTKAPQGKDDSGELPVFDILVPLQVPGDDALIYHADIGLEEFVATLAEFASRARVKILFRKHPYDETEFYSRMKGRYGSEYAIFDSRGHIHDVLQLASAVAVINSGVGFEAMIYDKPLLSFGRAVYDVAVGHVTKATIDEVYSNLMNEDPASRSERYRRFISWYVFVVGIKINEEMLNLTEDRLADPALGPNPVYSSLNTEALINVRGVKLIKLKSKQKWRRRRARVAHIFRQIDRAVTRNWRRFRKSNINQLDAQLKGLLLRDLDEKLFEGKRVALVGNASSLRRGTSGREIDQHDIVIRMNLGYPLTVKAEAELSAVDAKWIHAHFVDLKSTGRETLTLLRPDVPDEVAKGITGIAATGRKTDIWSCSTSDRTRQVTYAPVFNCVKVACHPAYQHLSWKLLFKNKVMRLKPPVYEDLSSALKLEPTSGLMWIEYLTRTKLESLDIYGFDFFASGHIARTTPNLLQAGGKWPHDPSGERDYVFESVLKVDPRVSLVDSDGTKTTLSA